MGSLWSKFKKWLSKTDPEGMTNFDGVVCFCLSVLLTLVVLIVAICIKDNNQTTTPPERVLIIREISVSTTDTGVSTSEQTTESSTGNLRNDEK